MNPSTSNARSHYENVVSESKDPRTCIPECSCEDTRDVDEVVWLSIYPAP